MAALQRSAEEGDRLEMGFSLFGGNLGILFSALFPFTCYLGGFTFPTDFPVLATSATAFAGRGCQILSVI